MCGFGFIWITIARQDSNVAWWSVFQRSKWWTCGRWASLWKPWKPSGLRCKAFSLVEHNWTPLNQWDVEVTSQNGSSDWWDPDSLTVMLRTPRCLWSSSLCSFHSSCESSLSHFAVTNWSACFAYLYVEEFLPCIIEWWRSKPFFAKY